MKAVPRSNKAFSAAAVVVFATACGNGADASGTAQERGAAVFQSMCAACHGETGKPNEMMVARLAVRDLTSPELRARVTPALVEAQVRNGSKNKLMPSFEGGLTDAEISAVAAYVASPSFVH